MSTEAIAIFAAVLATLNLVVVAVQIAIRIEARRNPPSRPGGRLPRLLPQSRYSPNAPTRRGPPRPRADRRRVGLATPSPAFYRAETGVQSVVACVDPIKHLWQPFGRSATGYLGVYPHRRRLDGGTSYAAMFKIHGRLKKLGIFRSAREAARRVAAEYERVYGPDWPAVAHRRRRAPWAVYRRHEIRAAGGRVRRVPVGWAASVWERGREVVLGYHLHPTDPRRDEPDRVRAWLFDTPAEAAAAARVWRAAHVPLRHPGLGPAALWR